MSETTKPKTAAKPAAKSTASTTAAKKPATKPKTTTSTTKPATKAAPASTTKTKNPAKDLKVNHKFLMQVKDIKKHYGKVEVLKGITFDVKPAERIAIVGANGAGKSTLSEIIARVKDASGGKIHYYFDEERDEKGKLIDLKESIGKGKISSKIGIQFQDSSYPDFYKVQDLVNFVVGAAGIKMEEGQLDHLYETFDLADLKKEVAKGLSGGQQQRLNIMLAIVNSPKLLILDEVGTGLDVESRTKIKSYIKSYAEENEAAILLVSHNSDEVIELVDRVIVLHNGEIFNDQPLEDVLEEWKNFDAYMNHLYLNVFKKNLDLRANKSGRDKKGKEEKEAKKAKKVEKSTKDKADKKKAKDLKEAKAEKKV